MHLQLLYKCQQDHEKLIVVAAAIDFPTQGHVIIPGLRIEPHKLRYDGYIKAVLHDSVPVAVSAKDAITAVSTCNVMICHAICAVGKLV